MLSDIPVRPCTAPIDVLSDLVQAGVSLIDGVRDRRDLLDLTGSFATVVSHRDSDADGVTVIEDRGAHDVALAGFTRSALSAHTDRSGIAEPPGLLLTACGREAYAGGEFVLVDGAAVHDELASAAPDALDALCLPRSAMFGGADGHLGSVFTHCAHGTIIVRLRLDALARFGPAVAPHLPALKAAIEHHTVILPAVAGAGYVLNNHRWLHGRLAYAGPRLMYRVTARPLSGLLPAGFRRKSNHTPIFHGRPA